MKYVILVSGKLQSGKNTFADLFLEVMKGKGYFVGTDLFAKGVKDGCKEDFKILANTLNSISEEIKANIQPFISITRNEALSNLYGIVERIIDKIKIKDENWYEKKTDITRSLLQIYGTEIFRHRVDNDWWAKQLRQRVLASDKEVTVITDTRFPNEITVFNDLPENWKVITVRVNRDVQVQQEFANHPSEISLDDWNEWNYIVDNNCTMETLKDSVTTIINDILPHGEDKNVGLFTGMTSNELSSLKELTKFDPTNKEQPLWAKY